METLKPNEPTVELLAAFDGWLHDAKGYQTASSFHWNSPIGPRGNEITCLNGTKVFVSESTIAAPGGRGERLASRTVTLPNGECHTFYLLQR